MRRDYLPVPQRPVQILTGPIPVRGRYDGPYSGTSGSTQACLIKFDLSSLTGGELVPNTPSLLHYHVSNMGNPATLAELAVAWDETTVTYNSLPWDPASWSDTSFEADEAKLGSSTSPRVEMSGYTGWRSVDVTASIDAWLSGTRTNNGWCVAAHSCL